MSIRTDVVLGKVSGLSRAVKYKPNQLLQGIPGYHGFNQHDPQFNTIPEKKKYQCKKGTLKMALGIDYFEE